MATYRKRTAMEVLDAIARQAEADVAIAKVAKKTGEEVARDLASAGYDLSAERARAKAQVEMLAQLSPPCPSPALSVDARRGGGDPRARHPLVARLAAHREEPP